MADDIAAVQPANADERQLHELGYAQELRAIEAELSV
jgi:hypothetical protein